MNMGQIWVCAGLTLAAMTNAACADILRLPSPDGEDGSSARGRLRGPRSEEPPPPVKAPRPAVQREILMGPAVGWDVEPLPRMAAPAKVAAADIKPAGKSEAKPKPRPAAKARAAADDGCAGTDGCGEEIAVLGGSMPVLNHSANPYLPRMLPPGAGIDWPAPQFSGAVILMPTGGKGKVDDNGIARSIAEPGSGSVRQIGHPLPADAPARTAEAGQTIVLTDWQKDDCLDSILDQIDDPASLQLTSDFQIDPRMQGQGGSGAPMRVAVDIASLDSRGSPVDSRLICTFEQRNGEWQFAGSRLRPAYRRQPSVM